MSTTGLDVFDTTIQKTNRWLTDLAETMDAETKQAAYQALRATLHALRDRITIEEVAQLSAQLPMLVRGIYFEGWDPTGKPLKERRKDEFLARIEQELSGNDRIDPETAARSVFLVLQNYVSEGEIEDIRQLLPARLRELWPRGAAAVAG